MLATIQSATLLGVTGHAVTVEVHVANGLPGYHMVGLPDVACRESRDRVRAAVLSSGLRWPDTRITVNLAPAGVRKGGAGLDLAIAVGVLIATSQLDPELVVDTGFVGELGLDGSIRAVAGVAPLVAAMPAARVVVPGPSWHEATAVARADVRLAESLPGLVGSLQSGTWPTATAASVEPDLLAIADLADVRGQPEARLGLEIAAAGAHHLLLVGPPGSGKTMLAQRLVGLLPPLDAVTALEATMAHSAAGARLPESGIVRRAPFRAPHHSSSMVSLVGGGSQSLRPGEISLAHGGVLFLDELGEFSPVVLDSLRQPLEEGVIRIARAHCSASLPARFLLVAATNPCPCGGGPPGSCECDDGARNRYLRRLSGPLLDRFDLRVPVQRSSPDDLMEPGGGEPTARVRARVERARRRAVDRAGILNGAIPPSQLDELVPVTVEASRLLRMQLERSVLTGRGYHRVRRVARTIADLDEQEHERIDAEHVALALSLRVRLRVSAGRDAA